MPAEKVRSCVSSKIEAYRRKYQREPSAAIREQFRQECEKWIAINEAKKR